jgi:acetyl esterase
LAELPPTHIITAEFDPLRDEGIAYADALRAAGVPVVERCYEGQIHTFFTSAHMFPAGRQAIEDAGRELRRAFQSVATG